MKMTTMIKIVMSWKGQDQAQRTSLRLRQNLRPIRSGRHGWMTYLRLRTSLRKENPFYQKAALLEKRGYVQEADDELYPLLFLWQHREENGVLSARDFMARAATLKASIDGKAISGREGDHDLLGL